MKKIFAAYIIFFSPFLTACDERYLGLPVSYTVKYEVTGTAASVDITMENAGAIPSSFPM
jgi:hypothetical protein